MENIDEGLLFSDFCVKVPENRTKQTSVCVDLVLSSQLAQFFKGVSSEPEKRFTLEGLNASYGLATMTSKPDFVYTAVSSNKKRLGLAIFEFKDTTRAPLEQMNQAYSSACNIIVSHLKFGLKWDEASVPLVLTNGNLYQFAWVTLLEPSFPVLHVTSGVLDASVDATRRVIAENLVRIKLFCDSIENKINQSIIPLQARPRNCFRL